jgi:hypothetical protein
MWQSTDNLRAIDVWAGNLDTNGNLRVAEIMAKNPKLIVARAATGQCVPEDVYAKAVGAIAGAHVEPYLVVNTTKPMATCFDTWSAQIGSARPKAIWMDCERADGQTKAHITAYLKDVFAEAKRRWTWAKVGCYTATWWWNAWVTHGWEANIPLWTAHYPFFVQNADGTWRQAYSFEEVDPRLPISNGFTPSIPDGWKGIAQPVIWQFSEKGSGGFDLNYVSRAWYDGLYGGAIIPVPERVRVEVRHPSNVEIVTVEV